MGCLQSSLFIAAVNAQNGDNDAYEELQAPGATSPGHRQAGGRIFICKVQPELRDSTRQGVVEVEGKP